MVLTLQLLCKYFTITFTLYNRGMNGGTIEFIILRSLCVIMHTRTTCTNTNHFPVCANCQSLQTDHARNCVNGPKVHVVCLRCTWATLCKCGSGSFRWWLYFRGAISHMHHFKTQPTASYASLLRAGSVAFFFSVFLWCRNPPHEHCAFLKWSMCAMHK